MNTNHRDLPCTEANVNLFQALTSQVSELAATELVLHRETVLRDLLSREPEHSNLLAKLGQITNQRTS